MSLDVKKDFYEKKIKDLLEKKLIKLKHPDNPNLNNIYNIVNTGFEIVGHCCGDYYWVEFYRDQRGYANLDQLPKYPNDPKKKAEAEYVKDLFKDLALHPHRDLPHKFNHVNDVWNYLDQFKDPDELEEAFGEIPNKFGSFEIINKDTYKEDKCIEIENQYYDKALGEFETDYHTVDLESED